MQTVTKPNNLDILDICYGCKDNHSGVNGNPGYRVRNKVHATSPYLLVRSSISLSPSNRPSIQLSTPPPILFHSSLFFPPSLCSSLLPFIRHSIVSFTSFTSSHSSFLQPFHPYIPPRSASAWNDRSIDLWTMKQGCPANGSHQTPQSAAGRTVHDASGTKRPPELTAPETTYPVNRLDGHVGRPVSLRGGQRLRGRRTETTRENVRPLEGRKPER